MPNLKDEILTLLRDFPPSNTEGKNFEQLLDDLAEDIQAAVIRALGVYGDCYKATVALPKTPDALPVGFLAFCTSHGRFCCPTCVKLLDKHKAEVTQSATMKWPAFEELTEQQKAATQAEISRLLKVLPVYHPHRWSELHRRLEETQAEMEHEVEMLANDYFGAALHNLLFEHGFPNGLRIGVFGHGSNTPEARKHIVRAMLMEMLVSNEEYFLMHRKASK